MKNLTTIIGKNLNNIRKQKSLSLDKVSELTGVSKAMIGQIERGESNPTVATLWKIATGLNVSFSYFMEEIEEDIRYVSCSEIDPILENDKRMKVYPLFPYDNKRRFEVFMITLEPGCNHQSLPHNEGVEEYIIVTKGKMELLIEDNIYSLSDGDAISYFANKKHTYRNISNTQTCFQHIIYYFK